MNTFEAKIDRLVDAVDEVLANLTEGDRHIDEETGEVYADIEELQQAVEAMR